MALTTRTVAALCMLASSAAEQFNSRQRSADVLLKQPLSLQRNFDFAGSGTDDFDLVVMPDESMTHSCANYVDDGTTVFTRNDTLVLKVSSSCPGGTCLNSGRVMSKEGFRYGVFVFKATVPKCNYVWPAIWLLPSSSAGDGVYGTWPCSGEIDVLETVHEDAWGAFNLVAGFGGHEHQNEYCSRPEEPVCNRCAAPAYCTSTTLQQMRESFYFVETPDCLVEHPTWEEHTFVLFWEPNKIATWVDPELTFDDQERLVDITPGAETRHMDIWGAPMDIPSWKAYERESTPTWSKVDTFMQQCFPETAAEDAPFDKEFKIVLNIAVGGYGGAACSWGEDECSSVCGGAVGSELVVSDIKVYQ